MTASTLWFMASKSDQFQISSDASISLQFDRTIRYWQRGDRGWGQGFEPWPGVQPSRCPLLWEVASKGGEEHQSVGKRGLPYEGYFIFISHRQYLDRWAESTRRCVVCYLEKRKRQKWWRGNVENEEEREVLINIKQPPAMEDSWSDDE